MQSRLHVDGLEHQAIGISNVPWVYIDSFRQRLRTSPTPMKGEFKTFNYEVFADSLSAIVIQRLAPVTKAKTSGKRRSKSQRDVDESVEQASGKTANDAAELGDFVEVSY